MRRPGDFSPKVIEQIARRAAFICSNPKCRKRTLSPSIASAELSAYTGQASHITAASQGGPRYDATMTAQQRKSIENGIHLCVLCATLIDKNDGIDYPAETLRSWKAVHEQWLLSQSVETTDKVTATNQPGTRSTNQGAPVAGGSHPALEAYKKYVEPYNGINTQK